MNENPSLPPLPQPEKKQPWLLRNKWGTFGFALLLLIPLLLFVLPDVMFLVWIVASIMCVVGLFHKPRLLAVLGMLASFVVLSVFVVVLLAAGQYRPPLQYQEDEIAYDSLAVDENELGGDAKFYVEENGDTTWVYPE